LGEVTAQSRRPEERIDWAQVKLIFIANWKTYFNRVTSRPIQLAANVIVVIAFLGYGLAFSWYLGNEVSKANLRPDGHDLAASIVHLVFLGVFFVIAITPVLGFRGNEFLDVTKLFTLPVGHRTVFAATLACLMGSMSVVVFFLPLGGVVLGYGGSTGQVFGGLAAAVLLVLVAVATGQFLQLAFLNTLKSRKWRDASMVLVPLFFAGVYAAFQVMARRNATYGGAESVFRWFDTWRKYTLPSPSWWAAHAVTGEGWTRYVPGLALVALLAWLVRASGVLEEKAFLGEVNEEGRGEGVAGQGPLARIASRLRDPLGALVEKEIAVLRREPVVRSMLIGQAVVPIIWGVAIYGFVQKHLAGGGLGAYAPFAGVVTYVLLWMEMGLLLNLLGLEGGGAVHVMLLPVPGKVLLMGKNVAFLLVFGTLNALATVVATVAVCLLSAGASAADCVKFSAIGAVEGYCVVAVAAAIGDVASVLTPIRVAVRDRRALRQQVGGREGCLWSLLRMAAMMGMVVLAAPIGVLLHLPYLSRLNRHLPDAPEWILFATVPAAVAFAYGMMHLGAWLGGSLLRSREEEIVARLAKSDE
jgi:hypothetical protein